MCRLTVWSLGWGLLLVAAAATVAPAQTVNPGQNAELQTLRSVYLQATDPSFGAEEPLHGFPNLAAQAPYRDPRLDRAIAQAAQQNDTRKQELLLTTAVKQFSIANFSDPAGWDYLLQLGRLKEARGDTARALFYYGLLLKHVPDPGRVQAQYDSLSAPRTPRYVDLATYYELVALRRRIDTLTPPQGIQLSMGAGINSEAPDYGPYLHPEGTVLLFTSRRQDYQAQGLPDYLVTEDLFYAARNDLTGGFQAARAFPEGINTEFKEGSACLNLAGDLLIFTRCDAPGGYGSCDLYSAEYREGRFQNIQNLGTNVNSGLWDSHPNLSPDGQWLYFTSNRGGGFGGTDLYRTPHLSDGSWGPAETLGPAINTLQDEGTPFLHPINQTLYFSSRGQLQNYGGYDIYKARWLTVDWEEPANLGPLVNTPADEVYFSIDGKGERLFYATVTPDSLNQALGNLDLYSFPMPINARPDATVQLSGYLVDSVTGRPLRGIVAAIDRDGGAEIAPIYTTQDGFFKFNLVGGKRYLLMTVGERHVTIKQEITPVADSVFRILSRGLELDKPIVFESVAFRPGSARITRGMIRDLDYLADFMKRNPYGPLSIEGHTSAEGSHEFNQRLSEKRAQNIRLYLLEQSGLPVSFISATGYGETQPIRPNDTEPNRTLNRRVEFRLNIPAEHRSKLKGQTIVVEDRTPVPDTTARVVPPAEPAPSPVAPVAPPVVRPSTPPTPAPVVTAPVVPAPVTAPPTSTPVVTAPVVPAPVTAPPTPAPVAPAPVTTPPTPTPVVTAPATPQVTVPPAPARVPEPAPTDPLDDLGLDDDLMGMDELMGLDDAVLEEFELGDDLQDVVGDLLDELPLEELDEEAEADRREEERRRRARAAAQAQEHADDPVAGEEVEPETEEEADDDDEKGDKKDEKP